MSEIIDQVRLGLSEKIDGLNGALNYVQDPIERDRLAEELNGATKALNKLDEPDTRTPEELEALSKMIDSEVEIETEARSWSTMSALDKFKYQLDLYYERVKKALAESEQNLSELSKVLLYLRNTDFSKFPFMRPIYEQFSKTFLELEFSVTYLRKQVSMKSDVDSLVSADGFMDGLSLLNEFLNNPMSLPQLTEARDEQLRKIREGK